MFQSIKLKSNLLNSTAILSHSSKRNSSFLDKIFSKKSPKQETSKLIKTLEKNDLTSEEAVNKGTATETVNFANTFVIGDSEVYEERLENLKAQRLSQLKIRKWNYLEESKLKGFSHSDILELISKYNIKEEELSTPFADYKTKFLFAKDLQRVSGRSLSDFHFSLFVSPEEFLQYYQKIYLSGSFDNYDETKPLAIFMKVGDDVPNPSNNVFLSSKYIGPEYTEYVEKITERTKVFSPKYNNVKIKKTKSAEEQKRLKEIIKEEAEYLNLQ